MVQRTAPLACGFGQLSNPRSSAGSRHLFHALFMANMRNQLAMMPRQLQHPHLNTHARKVRGHAPFMD